MVGSVRTRGGHSESSKGGCWLSEGHVEEGREELMVSTRLLFVPLLDNCDERYWTGVVAAADSITHATTP